MSRSTLSMLLCSGTLLLSATAGAGTIDFESVPGDLPLEGLAIGDQFLASEGVRFSLEGGGLPVLAATGSPMTAFGGGPTNVHDAPSAAAAAALGGFFLTDDGVVAAPPAPLLIHWSTPVAQVSGVLVDVDGWGAGRIWEAFRIEARGADDGVLETLELIGSIDGDGELAPWSFARALADIHSIRISYYGNKPHGIGFAFDALTASIPEPATALLLALGVATLAARRR